MSWHVEVRPDGEHVYPCSDLIEHQLNPSCVCAPEVIDHGFTCSCSGRPVLTVRRRYEHNAMDGRP